MEGIEVMEREEGTGREGCRVNLPDVVQPVEPGLMVVVWDDFESSLPDRVSCLLAHVSTVHIPLRLQQGLHYVLRTTGEEKHTHIQYYSKP
jgi:hypothetical protein